MAASARMAKGVTRCEEPHALAPSAIMLGGAGSCKELQCLFCLVPAGVMIAGE
jgi:hypothetical protein